MPPISALSLAALLAAAPAADDVAVVRAPDLPAGPYRVDPRRSALVATVRYAGGLGRLDLRFTGLSGGLWYTPGDTAMSRVTIMVDATSVSSGEHGGDRLAFHALEPDKYPTITFTSDRLSLTRPNGGRLQGRLTLHGVTRPVTLRFAMVDAGGARPARLHFAGGGRVSRRAFGVRAATPFTADDVELEFEAEFVQAPPQPAPPP